MEKITYEQAREMFEDMIHDVFGPVNIMGIEYDIAKALYTLDEVHYMEALADYIDSLVDDGYEVEEE